MGKSVGLLSSAKKLALEPAMSVYQNLTWLAGKNGDENGKLAIKNMDLKSTENKNQACTICDMTAYTLMVVAAGVTRIEKMKSGVNKNGTYLEKLDNKHADRGWLFRSNVKDSATEFLAALKDWSSLDDNGVVQFKFDPQSGNHTFMIERVPSLNFQANDKIVNNAMSGAFRVYQSYEGTYRLSDFLGLAGERDFIGETFTRYVTKHEELPSSSNTPYKGQVLRDYKAEWNKSRPDRIQAAIATFVDMTKTIGQGVTLGWPALYANVLEPCSRLLSGGLQAADYQKLAGVPSKDKAQDATKMVMLMCDSVTYDDFDKNLATLIAGDWNDKMTEYVNITD